MQTAKRRAPGPPAFARSPPRPQPYVSIVESLCRSRRRCDPCAYFEPINGSATRAPYAEEGLVSVRRSYPAEDDVAVRILSLNAWGGAMFGTLWPWLQSIDVDVLCFQEVTRTAGLEGWTTFADGERTLPQRADLFRDLQRALPGHQGYFVASDSGPVTDAHGRPWQQDFGVATFVHMRVSLIGAASSFVHGNFTSHVNWAVEDRPRAAHAVRVVGRGSEAPITVVHVHGLRDGAGKGDTPARRAQAVRLAEFVARTRGEGDVAVVCGDLNLLPDSETFDVLADIGLTDLVGELDTRTSWYAKPLRHASYMLVSDPSVVRRFEVLQSPEVSDHRPLIAQLHVSDPDSLPTNPGTSRNATSRAVT
jgi:endonuclease/exonuclease/phosphatase family metal-dependent hydrolase